MLFLTVLHNLGVFQAWRLIFSLDRRYLRFPVDWSQWAEVLGEISAVDAYIGILRFWKMVHIFNFRTDLIIDRFIHHIAFTAQFAPFSVYISWYFSSWKILDHSWLKKCICFNFETMLFLMLFVLREKLVILVYASSTFRYFRFWPFILETLGFSIRRKRFQVRFSFPFFNNFILRCHDSSSF